MKKTILAVLAMGALSCALFSQQTQAAPITGTIQFGGAVRFNTNSLLTATIVNVWFDDNNNPGHSTVEAGTTGDFAGIPVGTQATMAQPWIFTPSTPTPGLWSVGGFTFDLASAVVTFRSASSLTVEGTGTVSGNGFDPTEMDWAFTTQSAGGRTHLVFSFSANGSSGVPDGGATGHVAGRSPRLVGYSAALPEEVSSLQKFSRHKSGRPFWAATFFVLLTKRANRSQWPPRPR